MKQRVKVTYATLRNDNPELHGAYDAALGRVREGLGKGWPGPTKPFLV
jgi:hypothetical protein